ncbi:hypothetical protein [Kitasatospora aureofaciens]|uniref:hypothetical protein n=1 Tax=Kitasatospora aureofaciens TaxID=1894 RepID=UPI001F4022DE|nr:hypothetical protein [Kitasatospora aureofaciens]
MRTSTTGTRISYADEPVAGRTPSPVEPRHGSPVSGGWAVRLVDGAARGDSAGVAG